MRGRFTAPALSLLKSVADGMSAESFAPNTRPWVFKDVAHILVLFEAGFPGNDRFARGVDSIQLVKRNGRWWIAGILNEWPDPENPLPADLIPQM